MPKRDPRVTEYIRQRAPFARPILRHLRKVIHEDAPGLEESIKWGMPNFLYHGKIWDTQVECGNAHMKAKKEFEARWAQGELL